MPDSPHSRATLNATARYVAGHPERETHRGFRYSVVAAMFPGQTWGKLADEFCRARLTQTRSGDDTAMSEFRKRRDARFWEPPALVIKAVTIEDKDAPVGDSRAHITEGELGRAMGIDKQQGHYYAVVRAFGDGWSRLLAAERVETDEQLASIQRAFGVKSSYVAIDGNYKPTDVAVTCIERGWTMTRGDAKEGWDHYTETVDSRGVKTKVRIQRGWSPVEWYSLATTAGRDSKCRQVWFSNLTMKDRLARLISTEEYKFLVPRNAPPSYHEQMRSESRYSFVQGGKMVHRWLNRPPQSRTEGRANHFWDCEVMLTVIAESCGWLE
jgi:hypothetical protein